MFNSNWYPDRWSSPSSLMYPDLGLSVYHINKTQRQSCVHRPPLRVDKKPFWAVYCSDLTDNWHPLTRGIGDDAEQWLFSGSNERVLLLLIRGFWGHSINRIPTYERRYKRSAIRPCQSQVDFLFIVTKTNSRRINGLALYLLSIALLGNCQTGRCWSSVRKVIQCETVDPKLVLLSAFPCEPLSGQCSFSVTTAQSFALSCCCCGWGVNIFIQSSPPQSVISCRSGRNTSNNAAFAKSLYS